MTKGVSLLKQDGDSADPYVVVKLRDKTYECKYIEKNINPEWNFKMFAEINCNENFIIYISIYIYDEIYTRYINEYRQFPPMQIIIIMDHDMVY